MYSVSEAFLRVVQENTRRYYWTGRIVTAAGAVYEFIGFALPVAVLTSSVFIAVFLLSVKG